MLFRSTNKPTLFINTKMKVVNKAYKKIDIVPFDITARNQVGRSIEKEDVKNIAAAAADLLEHQSAYAAQIEELKNTYFYNLGHSGAVGADYIISRLTKKKKEKSETESK